MRHITFDLKINADVDKVFAVSTNYENLYKVTNGFYTISKIRSSREHSTLVAHRVLVLNKSLAVMIKHVIEKEHVHKSYWVGGDAKGTIVTETYERSGDYTMLHVDARMKLPVLLGIKSIFTLNDLKSNLQQMAQGIAHASES